MIPSPLNRTTAPQILRLNSLCLKNGVLDAYNLGDDYAAREFLGKHKKDWTYGVLGEPDDYDWKMWRFSLYRWCRRHAMATFAERYLYEIKRYNYLFCPLIMSMRFYLKGIEEWLAYPNPSEIEIFKQATGIHWGRVLSGPKLIKRLEILAEMQGISYEYRRLPESAQSVTPIVLDEFCAAIFDLTSKYVYKKRIIIGGKAVKNI